MHPSILFIKKHIAECLLLGIASIITIFSARPYLQSVEKHTQPEVLAAASDERIFEHKQEPETITVDISGAVLKSDIYEVTAGARLGDVIKQAGGLDKEADTGFIARNFNMARFLSDQEKIYLPTKNDIKTGLFTEKPQTLRTEGGNAEVQPTADIQETSTGEENALLISINDASASELDMLPGVGPTTAQKIIDSRPYATIDELLTKKAVKTNVFEDIKGLIRL